MAYKKHDHPTATAAIEKDYQFLVDVAADFDMLKKANIAFRNTHLIGWRARDAVYRDAKMKAAFEHMMSYRYLGLVERDLLVLKRLFVLRKKRPVTNLRSYLKHTNQEIKMAGVAWMAGRSAIASHKEYDALVEFRERFNTIRALCERATIVQQQVRNLRSQITATYNAFTERVRQEVFVTPA